MESINFMINNTPTVAAFDWAFSGGESEKDGHVGLRAMDGERVDRCGW